MLSSMGLLNRRLLCSITSCRKVTHVHQAERQTHQIPERASSPSPSYLQEGYGQVVVVVLLLNVLHRVPVCPAFQVVLQLPTVQQLDIAQVTDDRDPTGTQRHFQDPPRTETTAGMRSLGPRVLPFHHQTLSSGGNFIHTCK